MNPKAIFIEDDLKMREFYFDTLSRVSKMDFAIYATASEALKYISKDNTARVIVDWLLENENGLEVAINIKTRNPSIDVVMLSANSASLDKDSLISLESIGIDFIPKHLIDESVLENLTTLGSSLSDSIAMNSSSAEPINVSNYELQSEIAKMNLQYNSINHKYDKSRKIISGIASDIINDLKQIKPRVNGVVLSGNKSLTMGDILNDLEQLNENGLRLIELDRQLRHLILNGAIDDN